VRAATCAIRHRAVYTRTPANTCLIVEQLHDVIKTRKTMAFTWTGICLATLLVRLGCKPGWMSLTGGVLWQCRWSLLCLCIKYKVITAAAAAAALMWGPQALLAPLALLVATATAVCCCCLQVCGSRAAHQHLCTARRLTAHHLQQTNRTTICWSPRGARR